MFQEGFIMSRRLLLITIALTCLLCIIGMSNAVAAIPGTSLIHLKFDGDTTDSSGNGYDGENTGTIEYVDGVFGKAANFQNAYLELKNTGQLNFDGNTSTVSVWVKYNKTTKAHSIFRKPLEDELKSVLDAQLAYNGANAGFYATYGDQYHYVSAGIAPLTTNVMTEKWTLITWYLMVTKLVCTLMGRLPKNILLMIKCLKHQKISQNQPKL